MDDTDTIAVLAALAQPTRLEIFRQLIGREPNGLPAGELARLLVVPQNTLSAHLAVLSRAGLVTGTRHSRSIIYRANIARVQQMALFLLDGCCGGRADICAPLVADPMPRRSTKAPAHD
jgi:ArsR family transcriptional regulator, arsenate/arsenite/antimonite-responsive transcriptional repressor